MKKRYFTTLSLLIILTLFITIPVSAEGMVRKNIGYGQAADNAQVIKIPDHQAGKFIRCVFNRRIIFTSRGIYLNFGKLGRRSNLCLY
jgi:hypothetical protein